MIVWTLGTAIATAVTAEAAVVTGDHAAPREAAPGEAAPTAVITGAAPEGGPVPVTHHDPSPPGTAAIDHSPAKGIDPITEVGLDPQSLIPFSRLQVFPVCFKVSQQEMMLSGFEH